MVAVVAEIVGFFVVIRGASFAAHALPLSAFPGAAASNLLGVNPLLGLLVFLQQLTPDQLGELYHWIGEMYPEEHHTPASGFVGPADHLRMMRANILGALVRAGTDQAVSVISRLRAELPNDPWLPGHLKSAEEARRFANWQRLEPREALKRLGIDAAPYGSRAQSIVAAVRAEVAGSVPAEAPAEASLLARALDAAETVEPRRGSQGALKLKLLLIATEWRSSHGGVSTFNHPART